MQSLGLTVRNVDALDFVSRPVGNRFRPSIRPYDRPILNFDGSRQWTGFLSTETSRRQPSSISTIMARCLLGSFCSTVLYYRVDPKNRVNSTLCLVIIDYYAVLQSRFLHARTSVDCTPDASYKRPGQSGCWSAGRHHGRVRRISYPIES